MAAPPARWKGSVPMCRKMMWGVLVVGLMLIVASEFVWRFAIKRYTSASS